MRRMVLFVAFGLSLPAVADTPEALTFDDIVARAAPDPALLARTALIARWERELAATGRITGEGPTLSAEVGPRRTEDGAVRVQTEARIEVPIFSGYRTRAAADDLLRTSGSDVAAANAIESRLRLRTAYLDAWLAQERLDVIEDQRVSVEAVKAAVEMRVAEGAEAPYEVALVEGELQRTREELDGARQARGEAWGALSALATLPPGPLRLASPGPPELTVPEDASSRFASGLLNRSVGFRASLETAFVAFEHAKRRSRWSAAATLGVEADDTFATVGAAYRFTGRGESAAAGRERAAADAAIDRAASVEIAQLSTRFSTLTERARSFGPVNSPDAFDEALEAVALRMKLGKDRPSLALIVRRQLLDARDAALRRVHDAHVLIAAIDALLAGDAR